MRGFTWIAFAAAVPLASAAAAHPAAPAPPHISVGVPAGFEDLVGEQHAVLDIFMGGRRVATAEALFGSGHFRFADPAALVRALPGILAADRVAAELSRPDLDPHKNLVCANRTDAVACAPLHPEGAAIVFDESRFRVEVFVNPRLLQTRAAVAEDFLPAATGKLTLTQAIGGTITGTAGGEPHVGLADAAILGLGQARIRAGLGWQSGHRIYADTLAAELDRRDLRFTAGAFWTPGNEIVGRRKVLGLSLVTQFDTRTNRDQLAGVPLVVHLDQRSRVEVLVSGRLLSSGLYEAGNQALDTGALPEGSYEVLLRIVAPNGAVREERRFFTRNTRIPPLGKDAWTFTAGTLVDETTPGFLIGRPTGTAFAQAGWAHRLSPGLALDLGTIATPERQLFTVGGSVIRRRFQFDARILASPAGDFGLYGHLGSQPGGRLSYHLEGQLTASHDGRPLLPDSAQSPATIAAQPEFAGQTGRQAQVAGDIAYQLGLARFAVVGSWRRAGGVSGYAVGPSMRVPLWRGRGFELVANADYAQTERGRSGYVGLSLMLASGNRSFTAESGLRQGADGEGDGAFAALRGTVTSPNSPLGEMQAAASLAHEGGATLAAADLSTRNRLGEFAASLAQPLGGPDRTQYAGSFRLGLAASSGGMALGRTEGGEAAVVAKVSAAPDDKFELLVNEVPRGTLHGGQSLIVQLPAYRTYDIRLRAAGSAMLAYDSTPRRITLYPGNVAPLNWRTSPQLAIFARLVWPDQSPVAHAALTAGGELADTDEAGSFLIQLGADRRIDARLPDGRACRAELAQLAATSGYAAPGIVVCRPSLMTSPTIRPKDTRP